MAVAVDISEVHRFSLEEYHQLIESGALEDAHVEFIDAFAPLVIEVGRGGVLTAEVLGTVELPVGELLGATG
ncbi:MAG: hypothetical protein ACR2IP_09430 [Solirubrobacteraceae bacterium]